MYTYNSFMVSREIHIGLVYGTGCDACLAEFMCRVIIYMWSSDVVECAVLWYSCLVTTKIFSPKTMQNKTKTKIKIKKKY